MKIETLHQYFLNSSGVCTDTRKITNNCLFFALKGENFNGNKFAQEALDKGASKAIIDEINYHKNTGETILHKSALQLLQDLARYHREYLKIPIIALTGSNGKTTTKELINAVLSKKYNTVATLGNLNNHIGVPLTLLSMDETTELGIVEMGANHLKEIEQLCQITQPDYGYITNFGKAHLEGFGSIEGVIKGKSELFKYLYENKKFAFVNGNDPKQMELSGSIDRHTFGDESNHSYVRLLNAKEKLSIGFGNQEIQSQLIGIYNFHNIAAAIAIGSYFNVSEQKIKKAIEGYIPSMNRSQQIEKNGCQIILDAYNANPTSMMAALENFKQAKGENKLMILGDMFELGEEAEKEHQNIANFLSKETFGTVYLVGSNFNVTKISKEQKNIKIFNDYETLAGYLKLHPPTNAYILIKGSRGMALERCLEFI